MQYKNWTIEITGKTENRYGYLIDVKATQRDIEKTRQFDGIVSQEGLKSAVINWIDNEELKASLPSSGVIDFTPPTPAEPTPPTADELAREEWTKDWQQLQAVTKLEANGVNILTAAQKTALVAKVRTNFKVEYQDIV